MRSNEAGGRFRDAEMTVRAVNPGEAPPVTKRILLVDDEEVGTRMRGELLQAQGYSVVVKYSPFEALIFKPSEFDLAIIDFCMPGMTGRELLLRMRSSGAGFPIVLLTGSTASLSREDKVLFSQCIDKGEPIDRLLECVFRLLNPKDTPDSAS
jgi:CheY-like chemotaxis protein